MHRNDSIAMLHLLSLSHLELKQRLMSYFSCHVPDKVVGNTSYWKMTEMETGALVLEMEGKVNGHEKDPDFVGPVYFKSTLELVDSIPEDSVPEEPSPQDPYDFPY